MRKVMKEDSFNLLENMWGDKPALWKEDLKSYERYRTIINYFTRMRYLDKQGSLKLKKKDLKAESNHIPWFDQTHINLKKKENIIFGHWAALEGKTKLDNIIGLDTGCVWGNKLTAIRLEDKKLIQVKRK
jgi:bis(5'-nucleosyl)-tetraphosphatase (symmetrical)